MKFKMIDHLFKLALLFNYKTSRRFLSIFFVLLSFNVIGQSVGDYRTVQDGNWNQLNRWERWNGASWQTPTAVEGYPGQNSSPVNVTIRNTHDIVLNTPVANTIGNLVIGEGTSGSLQTDNTNRTLTVDVLFVDAGATYDMERSVLTVNTTTTVNGTINDSNNNGSNTFVGLVTINNGGSFSPTATSSFIFRGGILNNGTFSKGGTGTTTFETNVQTLSGSNSLTFSGNIIISDPVTLDISTDIVFNGSNLTSNSNAVSAINATSGTFRLNPNAAQTIDGSGSGTIQFFNLTAAGGNTKNINKPIDILGDITVNTGVTVLLGTASSSYSVAGSAIINGTFNAGTTAKTITINGDLSGTGTLNMSGAGLAHTLNLLGQNNTIGTFTTTASSGSTVNYLRVGDQQVFGSANYRNVNIDGGGNKSLQGTSTINNVLTLTSGVLQLGNNNLTLSSATDGTIQGSFDASHMIETDGTGYLQHAVAPTKPYTVPIGSNGTYSPVTVESFSLATYIRYRTVYDVSLGSQYLKRYWQLTTSAGSTASVKFGYDPAENPLEPTLIWRRAVSGTWTAPTGTSSFDNLNNTFTIASTNNISNTTSEWTAGYPPNTFFSYQSGNWNDASTWTSDPGGTTYVGIGIPSNDDVVVILPGRTVTLTADVASTGLEVNINSGGFLNMSTYRFTSNLLELNGSGTIQLSSTNFPTATTNTFVNAGGGTTEYNNASDFNLPASQLTYNNLTINLPVGITSTQLNSITLNGNLHIKQGTYRINNNSATTKLNLIIAGNVTVNSGAFITVGNGSTNTTTNPTAVAAGGTAPFLNYYEQFHRVVINGDFTNNGTVRFTNLDYPLYSLFPPLGSGATSGAASVYFQGSSNNTVLCNGPTDFYNLILDKGIDQTYSLSIEPSEYGYFRLFGANIATATITTANPELKKALWIRTGTLELKGLTVLPSLTEGTVANSEYIIPSNGALKIDGSDVIVMSTSDDYGEVNIAYGVSGGTGSVNGVNTTGAQYQGLLVYGKLQVNDGYFSTRESAGILYSSVSSGQFIINGGIVDAKQFRTYDGTTTGASYAQSGGTFILRGRFVRPVSYASIPSLSSTSGALSGRAVNGTSNTYGTFNLQFDDNVFSMSGGTVQIHDACGSTGPEFVIDIISSAANTSVTGGTFEILPKAGTVLADAASLLIWSEEAVYGNVTINRGVGCSTVVRLRNRPLKILKNFTITSGEFQSGGQNVTVGGNFTISTNGTYNSGTSTIFNGQSNQLFTISGTVNNGAPGLNNLLIDRSSDTLKIAGTQASLIVQGTFDLNGGVFNDGGKTISIAGNITNSGTHIGTGQIELNGTNTQTIGGDGNGIFQNLNLNNTNAAAAPIALTVGAVINGSLTFSQDKLFDISTYNLKLNATASIANYGNNRYIQTNGDAGDGGLTIVYPSASAITFPVGAPSTRHAAANYTPATIGFTSAPTTLGSVTVIPVGYEHPATTIDGQSLTYFWRVKSSGFTGVLANSITHSFQYSPNDVVGTLANYIPTLYDRTTYSWVNGTNSNPPINIGTSTFTDWTTPGDSRNYLDADYTAGDNAFGSPLKFYSIAGTSGTPAAWNSSSTWSYTSGGPAIGGASVAGTSYPGSNSIAIIEDNHYVNLTANASCASLQIETGSTLDIYTWSTTASNFGMVQSHPSGNGLFRLTTTVAPSSSVPKFFTFPSGDFSDFNINGGTTEFYDIDGTVGALYILPANVGSYGNLILTARGGDNLVLPNRSNLTIYGDLTCTGDATTAWITMSWNTNIWPYFSASYDPTIEKTVHITGNLYVNAGSFYFFNDEAAQHLIVDKDVVVVPGAVCGQYNAYPFTTPVVTNTFAIGGSLINNGTFNVSPATGRCDLTFFGSTSASITNTTGTPSTTVNNVTINKGSSQATTLTCDIGGTLTTPNNNWLTLQNGTFRFMRTDPTTDFEITRNASFTIPETAGLYVDYSNANNIDILISNTNTQDASDLYLDGKLTIVRGNVYIGNGTSNVNNDIEYAGGGFSEILVQGGTLRVNGQIRRNPAMSAGILKYTQSGGDVTILGYNASSTNAKFEVCNSGSSFNMSGGTITVVRGGGGATYGDLYLRPGSSSATGGTIYLQPVTGITAAQETFIIDASVPVYNLTITGFGATDAARASLHVNPLVVNGNLTFSNTNSYLTTNNIDLTVKGNLTNNGNVGSYVYGTNLTTFNGNTQVLNGTSATNFYDLKVSPITSLTLNNGYDVTVDNDLELSSGTLICGNYAVNLKRHFTNNASYTDSQYGVILNGSGLQQVSGSGTFNRLELDNLLGASTLSDITLNGDLVLSNGILDINDHLLTLGQFSDVTSSFGFGLSRMIITNGVFSDQGIKKYFGTGPSSFTYPLGVSGKYTKADLTISASTTVGSIRLNNINDNHPAVIDPANVLQYYWEVESSAITGFSGSLVLNYLNSDVSGGPETNYLAARLIVPGTSWSKTSTVDAAANTITFNFTGVDNLSGEYTAGVDPAFPNNVPIFRTKDNGDWNDPNTWEQVSGDSYTLTAGPNGFIVIIDSIVTTDANYCQAYRTTINGEFRSITPYFGHNLGTVDGSGKLYLQTATIPAGKYDSFFDCSNLSILEYGGAGSYTLIADLYDQIPNLVFSGTGSRVLPDKDLTICNSLDINGPTLDNSTYNRKLTILGTMSLTSGAFTSGTGSGATVTFAGSATQTISNFSGSNAFNNIEIDNSAGLTINSDIEIKGNLLLTEGLINTSATNSLTITNTSINCVFPSGGSSTSYVNGPLVKRLNQGSSYFNFPVGNSTQVGNMLSLKGTQAGTLNWTVAYVNPSSLTTYSSPLTAVNTEEYWTVSAPSGSQAYVNIKWDPSSDLTPLMTQNGVSDMRVTEHDGANWIELSSITTAGSDNYNGSAETSSRITIVAGGSNNYTLACVNLPKPRIRFSPSGSICGSAGIPVTLSTSYTIYATYTIEYTINGVPQTPVNPASFPYTLATGATGGDYQLTGFTYNLPAGTTRTGVVDITTITTYTVPTIADAGGNQSVCGGTSVTLDANTPAIGTGLWSVSGAGGTVVFPTVPTSQFNGTNGSTYTLTWTITNGGCTSSDDVVISFPLLPEKPAAFILSDNTVCQGDNDVDYSVANNPSLTYTWSYTGGFGATISGSGNAIQIDYAVTATSGSVEVYTTNGCGNSDPLTLAVTVNTRPVFTVVGSATDICDGDLFDLTTSFTSINTPSDIEILLDGTPVSGSPFNRTDNTDHVYSDNYAWIGPAVNDAHSFTITVTDNNGCASTTVIPVTFDVWKKPETGPQYHVPNTFGF